MTSCSARSPYLVPSPMSVASVGRNMRSLNMSMKPEAAPHTHTTHAKRRQVSGVRSISFARRSSHERAVLSCLTRTWLSPWALNQQERRRHAALCLPLAPPHSLCAFPMPSMAAAIACPFSMAFSMRAMASYRHLVMSSSATTSPSSITGRWRNRPAGRMHSVHCPRRTDLMSWEEHNPITEGYEQKRTAALILSLMPTLCMSESSNHSSHADILESAVHERGTVCATLPWIIFCSASTAEESMLTYVGLRVMMADASVVFTSRPSPTHFSARSCQDGAASVRA